ncbi:MAG: DUF2637 domain-containing protein [Chloroflexi bacterium]|nr:DUF2637 domain-containing protein [Chloroflexota bacterium]
MAWLYPAIIDGAIIVFSLSVVQVSLAGERPRYPWVLVGVFTALSVMLNILHAAATILPKLMAAIPPVALFLSFELLMNQIKWAARRQSLGQTVAELEQVIANLQAERSRLEGEIAAATTALKSKNEALRAVGLRLSQREEATLTRENPGALPAEPNAQDGKTPETDKAEIQRGRTSGPTANGLGTPRSVPPATKDESQAQLLAYLLTHPQANHRDMAEVMGRAKSTIQRYIQELQAQGTLAWGPDGWQVIQPRPTSQEIPNTTEDKE